MPTNEFFSEHYAHARTKFLSAAQDAGAVMRAYEHPSQRGPDGERLSIDVGVIGPPDAPRGLLLISGTHGVEGEKSSGGRRIFGQCHREAGSVLEAGKYVARKVAGAPGRGK